MKDDGVMADGVIKSEEKLEVGSNEEPIKQKIKNSKNVKTFDREYRIEDSDDQLDQHLRKIKEDKKEDNNDT